MHFQESLPIEQGLPHSLAEAFKHEPPTHQLELQEVFCECSRRNWQLEWETERAVELLFF